MERKGCGEEYINRYEKYVSSEYGSVEDMLKAANNGKVNAMRDASLCYLHGLRGLKKNLYKAKQLLLDIIERGSCYGRDFTNLALLFEELPENPQPTDPMKAFPLYQRAAELGDNVAQFNLAGIYQCGIGDQVEVNLVEAEKWYRLAAGEDTEDQSASLQFGRLLSNSVNCFGTSTASFKPCQARFQLWKMYSTNDNPTGAPDHDKAVEQLQAAAEEGFVDAEREYGKLFLEAKSKCKIDVEIAKIWLIKAAEKGDAEAKRLLENVSKEETRTSKVNVASPSNDNSTPANNREVQRYDPEMSSSEFREPDYFDVLFQGEAERDKIRQYLSELKSTQNIKIGQMNKLSQAMKRRSEKDIRFKNPKIYQEEMFLQYPDSPTAMRYLKALRYFEHGVELLTKESDPGAQLEGVHLLAKGYITENTVCQSFDIIIHAMITGFRQVAINAVSANEQDFLSHLFLVRTLQQIPAITVSDRICGNEKLVHKIENAGYEKDEVRRQILHYLYTLTAITYSYTDQHHRALDCFQKAHAMKGIEDDDNDALRGVAIETDELGDKESAIDLYKEYLRVTPKCARKYAAVHYNLAVIYFTKKCMQLAFHHYQQGVKAEKNRLAFFDAEDNEAKKLFQVSHDVIFTDLVCHNPDCQGPDSKKLKQCPCKLAHYCSVPCQKAHRPTHKKVCTVATKKCGSKQKSVKPSE